MLKATIERARITPANYDRIMAGIAPKDQRRHVCCGDTISHYTTGDDEEQTHITIWHNLGRAAVCWVWDSEWGDWHDDEQSITLDEPCVYGERVIVSPEHQGQEAAAHV